MVATSRIVKSDMLTDFVRVHFSDGGTEDRPYEYDSSMAGVEGCTGRFVEAFPVENEIPDMIILKNKKIY